MRRWNGSSLVQVMACRRTGDKPLHEPVMGYCQLDSLEQISVKFESEFYHFHSRKFIWKCRLPEWRPFCPGGDELSEARVWSMPHLIIAVLNRIMLKWVVLKRDSVVASNVVQLHTRTENIIFIHMNQTMQFLCDTPDKSISLGLPFRQYSLPVVDWHTVVRWVQTIYWYSFH